MSANATGNMEPLATLNNGAVSIAALDVGVLLADGTQVSPGPRVLGGIADSSVNRYH